MKNRMFWKIVLNDFKRKKIITLSVFILMTMAVILGSSATNIIANLIQSITDLKEKASPADIAQMHAGEYSQASLDRFTEQNQEHIAMQETMTLLPIEGFDVQYGDNKTFGGTIQDIFFVVQNKKFDFLLDLNNEKLEVGEGEVAVPIHFMVEHDLQVGDTLTVATQEYTKAFTISDYVRDYEMNAAIASSKRFVVNPADYEGMLEKQTGTLEYIIEFKLKENGSAQAVQTAYIEAGLPANGPTVGAMVFMLFNAMSDVAIAMVIVVIGSLLIVISAFCIKLTFLATMDEDLREIGVMKAMGLCKRDIRGVYLTKYRVMALVAGLLGYLLSFGAVQLFSGNMRLFLSSDLTGNLKFVLSLVAPLLVYLMIMLYCKKVLKRIDAITAVQALRSDTRENGKSKNYRFSLMNNKFLGTNLSMALRDVAVRFKLYRLLLGIFIVSTFIVILPLNVYNTMNSPDFSTYMGIGKSDMRIDVRKTKTIVQDFQRLQEELAQDSDIHTFAAYVTCYYQIQNTEGAWDYVLLETGDFSVFPLQYLQGRAPMGEGEIALSYANASVDGLHKNIGDEVVIKVGGVDTKLKVCGIYQDITNGGKTAKAHSSLGLNEDSILWYIVNIDVVPGVEIREKMDYYQSSYATAQVNDIREYTRQTLGNLIDQMGKVVLFGGLVAILIVVLITALFLKMLLSKDMSQIAIMRSVGLNSKTIRGHYMTGTITILVLGIIVGVIASHYLGGLIVSMAMSSMGVASMQLIEVPWQTWLVCPLMLIVVVGLTVSICCRVTVEDDISVVLRS